MSEQTHRQDPEASPTRNPDEPQNPPASGSFGQAFMSVVAAAFGVQSEKNRQKDFSGSSPLPYIVAGLVFTLVFIGILVAIVSLVLS